MANPPPQDSNYPQLTVYVDSLDVFDEVAITDPTELAALYLPLPKNLVVPVDNVHESSNPTVPAPTDLDGPPNP